MSKIDQMQGISEEIAMQQMRASMMHPPPVQPMMTYEEVCSVLALQEKLAELAAENESLSKDNANLIAINFNLEQQLSAKTEDLEDALESIESWETRCDGLEDRIVYLEGKIDDARELLG